MELVRDGTIAGPSGTEIDLRTKDYEVWITVKSDSDERAEIAVGKILSGDVYGEQ